MQEVSITLLKCTTTYVAIPCIAECNLTLVSTSSTSIFSQQHQIIQSKGYENYLIDDQRESALIFYQILSTILK